MSRMCCCSRTSRRPLRPARRFRRRRSRLRRRRLRCCRKRSCCLLRHQVSPAEQRFHAPSSPPPLPLPWQCLLSADGSHNIPGNNCLLGATSQSELILRPRSFIINVRDGKKNHSYRLRCRQWMDSSCWSLRRRPLLRPNDYLNRRKAECH